MRLCWSFALSALINTTLTLVCGQGWLIVSSRNAASQEAEFKPRWDGVAKPKRAKQAVARKETPPSLETAVIYSFDRYAWQLRQICNLLERDHRRERVSQAAGAEIRAGGSCKSCKAFLKEIVEQCHYRKTVVVRPTVGAKPSTEILATPSGDTIAGVSAMPTAEPIAARYPLTELIDRTSALSSELSERDAGEGAIFESVKFFVDLLMKQKDLTPAERDYYGIFTTYLLSAWSGREESSLESSKPSKEELRALFEGG